MSELTKKEMYENLALNLKTAVLADRFGTSLNHTYKRYVKPHDISEFWIELAEVVASVHATAINETMKDIMQVDYE